MFTLVRAHATDFSLQVVRCVSHYECSFTFLLNNSEMAPEATGWKCDREI